MQQVQLIALILVGALVMGGAIVLFTSAQDDDEVMDITVTLAWQKEMVEWIGGENVKATHMVRPGQDPHVPEGMTPSQVIAAAKSPAYFYIGAGMGWETANIPTIESELPNLKMVKMSEGVELITGDAHIWTSPDNLLIMANNTKNALIEIDPANEQDYINGYNSYAIRVFQIKALADELLEPMAGNDFLVYHSAWKYLAQEYGINEYSIQPLTTGGSAIELTVSNIQEFVDWIETQNASLTTMFVRPFDPVNSNTALKDAFVSNNIEIVIANPLSLTWLEELETFINALYVFWEDSNTV